MIYIGSFIKGIPIDNVTRAILISFYLVSDLYQIWDKYTKANYELPLIPKQNGRFPVLLEKPLGLIFKWSTLYIYCFF